ncbi:MAG: hypothetical protein GY830_03350 [Bacteroidetes bacterium]|nr:hypothetical protein [Bacteroidota bacterium]
MRYFIGTRYDLLLIHSSCFFLSLTTLLFTSPFSLLLGIEVISSIREAERRGISLEQGMMYYSFIEVASFFH